MWPTVLATATFEFGGFDPRSDRYLITVGIMKADALIVPSTF